MDKIIKILAKYYPVFLKGLGGTMWLAGVTLLAGTVLGLLVAFLRMSKFKPLWMSASEKLCHMEPPTIGFG